MHIVKPELFPNLLQYLIELPSFSWKIDKNSKHLVRAKVFIRMDEQSLKQKRSRHWLKKYLIDVKFLMFPLQKIFMSNNSYHSVTFFHKCAIDRAVLKSRWVPVGTLQITLSCAAISNYAEIHRNKSTTSLIGNATKLFVTFWHDSVEGFLPNWIIANRHHERFDDPLPVYGCRGDIPVFVSNGC